MRFLFLAILTACCATTPVAHNTEWHSERERLLERLGKHLRAECELAIEVEVLCTDIFKQLSEERCKALKEESRPAYFFCNVCFAADTQADRICALAMPFYRGRMQKPVEKKPL